MKNSDEVPAAVSRRSHLTTSVTAPVAAAVGAKGLVAVAQDLAARRAGDVVVLDRVTRHVNDLFAEDEVLATAASFSILTRIKSAWSANEKLTAKGLDHVNSLRDIAGVRVVVDEGPQPIDEEAGYALCYRVLRSLAMSPYVREVTDLKDYVRAPKPNGYRSLHATIVPTSSRLPRFEIQVRTRAMDDVAIHGTAAHRAYKLAAASSAGASPAWCEPRRRLRLFVEQTAEQTAACRYPSLNPRCGGMNARRAGVAATAELATTNTHEPGPAPAQILNRVCGLRKLYDGIFFGSKSGRKAQDMTTARRPPTRPGPQGVAAPRDGSEAPTDVQAGGRDGPHGTDKGGAQEAKELIIKGGARARGSNQSRDRKRATAMESDRDGVIKRRKGGRRAPGGRRRGARRRRRRSTTWCAGSSRPSTRASVRLGDVRRAVVGTVQSSPLVPMWIAVEEAGRAAARGPREVRRAATIAERAAVGGRSRCRPRPRPRRRPGRCRKPFGVGGGGGAGRGRRRREVRAQFEVIHEGVMPLHVYAAQSVWGMNETQS